MKTVFNPFTGLLDYIISSISELTTKDHHLLSGLLDDDHTQYLLANGTRALTGNWNAGAFSITANNFISDVAIGTQPYACTSTTLNTNLNADMLDGKHVGTSGNTVPLLDQENDWSSSQRILTDVGIVFGSNSETLVFYSGGVWYFSVLEPTTEILFNGSQLDTNFRITGIGNANLFFVDASTDRIGIGKNNPATILDVNGVVTATNFISSVAIGTQPYACTSTTLNTNLNADMLDGKHVGTSGNVVPLLDGNNTYSGTSLFTNTLTANGGVVFNENGNNYDFRVEGDTDQNLFFVDASADCIGIGINTPTAFLHQKASNNLHAAGRVPASAVPPAAPNEGDYWNDARYKANIDFIDGINQARVGCTFTQTAAVTVANRTAETTLVGAGNGTATLPANFFVVGKTIRITASGFYSLAGTAGQTLQMRIRLGATQVLTTVAGVTTAAVTNRGWRIIAEIICWGTGVAGGVVGQGLFFRSTSNIATAEWDMVNIAAIALDTTIVLPVSVTADWNSAAAGDTITCTDLMIEVLY